MKKIENNGVRIQFYPTNTVQIQAREGTEPGEENLRIIELFLVDGQSYSLTYDLDVPAEASAYATDLATVDALLS